MKFKIKKGWYDQLVSECGEIKLPIKNYHMVDRHGRAVIMMVRTTTDRAQDGEYTMSYYDIYDTRTLDNVNNRYSDGADYYFVLMTSYDSTKKHG